MVRAVATPWHRLAKFIVLGFGVPFSLIGLVSYIVLDGNWAFLFNGLLWMIIGGGLKIKGVSEKRNLELLKSGGHCYEGTVVNIIPAHWVRIGSYVTARVECVYQTEDGDHLIKSGYHLLSPFDRIENFHAKIHFDNNNSAKYAIELFRGDNGV